MKHPKHIIHKLRGKKSDADSAVPRITTDNVAEHREQVLGSARKFIYPLQHTKRRVVTISIWLFGTAIIVFLVACTLALYKFQSSSTFVYDVTKVLPFPVARAGGRYVSYESYLFELRRYQHYYESQQRLDFSTPDGQKQLANYKKQAMAKVETDAYVKNLAEQHNISISDREVNDEVTLLRAQNRLGSSNEVFENVLEEYWGWSVNDFKRELKTQLLAQKVAATLDTATRDRANAALAAIQQGTDFGQVAGQYSDDAATKGNGGQYGSPIERGNQDIDQQVLDQIFKLQPGQVSGLINTGDSLQIVKVIDGDNTKRNVAVVVCTFKNIADYVQPLRKQEPPKQYIGI
ncbi:MAG: hypothetical protein JWM37_119 [Candidatus Saccharibacteria bacterium]|nr:hypothetical protein [Candidatus Saccharibacteria bacterium]